MDDLTALTSMILRRLRDPQADFQLQASLRGMEESLWLTRRAAKVTLSVLGPGGGEVDWNESGLRDTNPQRAFDQLRDRIDLVVLHAGGPFPDDLMPLFLPDETQPLARYKAEWPSWDEFYRWLGGPGQAGPP